MQHRPTGCLLDSLLTFLVIEDFIVNRKQDMSLCKKSYEVTYDVISTTTHTHTLYVHVYQE